MSRSTMQLWIMIWHEADYAGHPPAIFSYVLCTYIHAVVVHKHGAFACDWGIYANKVFIFSSISWHFLVEKCKGNILVCI